MTTIAPQPYEIRLVVDTQDDRYTARWIAPDAPESEMGNHDRAAELY
jgi:hypothetical protein